jgi:uridylate kinase
MTHTATPYDVFLYQQTLVLFMFARLCYTAGSMYKRILLKFSGEQLSGKHDYGIDPDMARYIAGEAKKVVDTGCELILVIGGGNLVRGAEVAGNGIKRVTADQMGMLSGLMNAMALTDMFEQYFCNPTG